MEGQTEVCVVVTRHTLDSVYCGLIDIYSEKRGSDNSVL